MEVLSYEVLKQAVSGNAAAIRTITRLEPAGGPGDKLFPPTYVKEGKAETKYALETRRIGGREARVVLIDSVASQANRMEEALLEGWRRGELRFPVVQVDFSKEKGLEDLEQITALQAPHRIADAILRDSLLDGQPFRMTPVGTAFTESTPNRATGMYRYCPTALIFGIWDSTGPKGGMGAKFQRCITSEIVGVDAVTGVKTASRLDPMQIERKAGPVFAHKDEPQGWTLDAAEAAKDKKGQPIPYGGDKEKGLPSAINHGNIPPSIDMEAGGVTVDHAVHTTVLSLAGLRRLRFPLNVSNTAVPQQERDVAEAAARTALAALGLAGIVWNREVGYDLRSRCVMVPTEALVFELVANDGSEPKRFTLTRESASALLAKAGAQAAEHGFGWEHAPISLKPAPKLVQLVRHSRDLSRAGDTQAGA